MRKTADGYIIGRSLRSVVFALGPGLFFIGICVALMVGLRPVKSPILFFGSLGCITAVLIILEAIILASFIRRPTLLATDMKGVTFYPVRAAPFSVPWSEVATMSVTEAWVARTRMRSLALMLRPSPASNPDEIDRINLPEHQLPRSALKCLRTLSDGHREQIALNNIVVFDEPQIRLGVF